MNYSKIKAFFYRAWETSDKREYAGTHHSPQDPPAAEFLEEFPALPEAKA
jgi:hypothetical protein